MLHTGNTAVAVVGPAAFGALIARALERSEGWLAPPVSAAPVPEAVLAAWPMADTAGVYTAVTHDGAARDGRDGRGGRGRQRLTLAVRVPDPLAAAAAADRLGAPDSPLVARLRLLPEAWRAVQVAGVARAHGGCVGVVLESAQHPLHESRSEGAALAAALTLREVTAELSPGATTAVAGRQILMAADPREAASRAAWWSLAGTEPGAPVRWVAALGLPPPTERSVRDTAAAATDPAADAHWKEEIDRALATAQSAGAERRFAVERGQGELWLLLASPCGVAEEGGLDAGFGALATLTALETRRRADGVTLEPWITADGLGVIAHAALRDEREAPADLARRVADAGARVLTAASPPPDAAAAARGAVLEHLERTAGPQGAALAVLAAAAAPDHPSWLDPFGLWSRVAGAAPEAVRLRAQALAHGPLRVAVLANADAAQAAVAGDATDRWLSPLEGPRLCHGSTASAPRPGRYEARLPEGAPLAQGLVSVPVPAPGAPGRDLAELTATALDGGLLATALADATATARLMGGARTPTLVVDVRAPADGLSSAVADVKALLLRLSTTVTEADLGRALSAWEHHEQESRADPRRRLVDLWSGRPAVTPPSPKPPASGPAAAAAVAGLASWRAFLGATLRDGALLVVEARAQ